MEKCPQCGEMSMMGRGFRASGICRSCHRMNSAALDTEASIKRHSPDAEVVMPVLEKFLAPIRAGNEICPECGQTVRRKYGTNAERQRAYRERKRHATQD